MPTEEKVDQPNTTGTWSQSSDWAGQPPNVWTVYDVPIGDRYIYRHWDNTPEYFKKKDSGQVLPINSYRYHTWFRGPWFGKYRAYGTGNPSSWFEMSGYFNRTNPGQYLVDELLIPERNEATYAGLYDTCVNDLLAKVKDQDVNIWQVYAERQRTMDLILTSLTILTNVRRELGKGNLGKAAGHLGITVTRSEEGVYRKRWEKNPIKAAASLFLSWQYGWKPLLQDIYGALKFIEKQSDPEQAKTIKVSARKREKWKDEVFHDIGLGAALIVKQTLRFSQAVKISAEYRIVDPYRHTLASLGLLNPGAVAWEVLPGSFIVDWALPIGKALSALDATVGVEFVRGTVSSKYTVNNDAFSHGSTQTGWTYDGAASAHAERTLVTRDPLAGFPLPRLPRFKNPISPTHIANAIALLITAFGGPSGSRPRFHR